MRKEMPVYPIAVVNCGMAQMKVDVLLKSFVACVSDLRIDSHESPHAFLQALRQRGSTYKVVIFMLADRYDLACLQTNKECFSGIKTVVVLSSGLHDALPNVHQLSPRYIGYEDDRANGIVAVLSHMVKPKKRAANTFRKSDCSIPV